MENKLQGKLNQQAEKFRPKKGKRISYQQPQRQGNRTIYRQPK